ncbi:MAG TPA: diaminopimelate decarboxylase [Actinospica sp.]|jgi:diaminopimelate decarboxylase|nr:diaminopimelate decarboxylase [Actinospica sp.]
MTLRTALLSEDADGEDTSAPDALGTPWPASAREHAGRISVGGVDLEELAERFGTPLYVLDEAELRSRAAAYVHALDGGLVRYAAKAFFSPTVAQWVRDEGLGVDVCSVLALALDAGFASDLIVLHGVAKTHEELETAVREHVGRIVIDGFTEIAHLASLAIRHRPYEPQGVYVRVIPGIAVGHHEAVQTGAEDQQFGLSLSDGSALDAVTRILGQEHLRLYGLHCHLGSQITTVEPYLAAIDRLATFLADLHARHGVQLPELDLGGGQAIAYRPGGPSLEPGEFATAVTARLRARCAEHGLTVPRLVIEPGRSIVGPAGVALYRVLAVKTSAHGVHFAAVDGGMSDNPRPALYHAEYTIRPVERAASSTPLRATRVVGRHCEAGDVLAPEALLPADLRPGDVLAVPAAGAYQLSMSSAYNLVGRPPLVAVRDGVARLVQRRETLADLTARDAAVIRA